MSKLWVTKTHARALTHVHARAQIFRFSEQCWQWFTYSRIQCNVNQE